MLNTVIRIKCSADCIKAKWYTVNHTGTAVGSRGTFCWGHFVSYSNSMF